VRVYVIEVDIPFYNPQSNTIPQSLQAMENGLPRFFFVNRRRRRTTSSAIPAHAHSTRRIGVFLEGGRGGGGAVGMQRFLFSQGEVVGYAVRHGHELDEEEVEGCGCD
jgi:hypothetical protein